MPRALVLLIALVLTCGSAPRLFVAGPVYLRLEDRRDPFRLRTYLYPELASAGINRIELVAGPASVVQERAESGSMVLWDLPQEALHAILLVLPDDRRGAEIDVHVEGKEGEPDRIWTVRRDLDDGIVIVAGPEILPDASPDVSGAELAARFGIARLEDSAGARWSPRERATLARALEGLRPEELDLLRGLVFARAKRGPSEHAGQYDRSRTGLRGRITLYDIAFTPNEVSLYVGSADAAVPYSIFVIYHEIAHAIADLQRERLLAAGRQAIARYNAFNEEINRAAREYNRDIERAARPDAPADLVSRQQALAARIARDRDALRAQREDVERLIARVETASQGPAPIERRYAELPDAKDGPTLYGRTNVTESFAESFALFHVDPESLERVAPAVHAWFTAGGHLDLAVSPSAPGPPEL